MFNRIIIVALVIEVFVGFGTEVSARNRNTGEYAVSNKPYWKVGVLNNELSSACQRGKFGQRKKYWVTVGFIGNKGQGIVGVATSTWNLFDPGALAKPKFTYHFFNQDFSNCRVFEAKQPPRRG